MDRMRYLFGVITLIVMAVGGYFLFRLLEKDDSASLYRVEVTFLDARGLKPGADLKFRGIQVGSVRDVNVDEDGGRAIVVLTIAENQQSLIRDNSMFWIVTPRFHGIADGVSGLDTLVRDSYMSFSTPKVPGELVANGSRLTGAEMPEVVRLPLLERGDLLMRVLLPENHGVALGAKVMFRGMPTGEVRSIALAPNGSHVIVEVRIAANYRSTVTDTSVFWVAQPQLNLQFSFSNPVSVNELGSLLSPHIAYFTTHLGVPLSDGDVVAAHLKRPGIKIPQVPKSALKNPAPERKSEAQGPIVLVRVIYAAVDVDWLSPNDTLHREGTGVLFLDANNQPSVLTARSICDANYYHNETFGWKEITNERIRIQLNNGQALTATRSWVEKNGIDIVVLRIEGLPRDYPTSKVSVFSYIKWAPLAESVGTGSASQQLYVCGESGVQSEPVDFRIKDLADSTGATKLDTLRGGLVMRGKTLVGLVGQVSGTESQPVVVSFETLPESLRPTK